MMKNKLIVPLFLEEPTVTDDTSVAKMESTVLRHVPVEKVFHLRGPFAKSVDSSYYSESEFCRGAVTVSLVKVHPSVSDVLLTTLHPLLENVLQTINHFEMSCLGAPFSWFEKHRSRMGRVLN
jgi:hypothetical protein